VTGIDEVVLIDDVYCDEHAEMVLIEMWVMMILMEMLDDMMMLMVIKVICIPMLTWMLVVILMIM
jgi:hypothetical protein